MAYNTNIDYYNQNVKNSYESNISGLLLRIEDAHAAIRSKAIELGLTIPAGKYSTSNASGNTEVSLSADAKILDTAAAINNIPINTDTGRVLGAGEVYNVPVGYNAVVYTITASGLGNQTDGTALREDILIGKTAWVNGEKLIGTLKDKSGDQQATEFGSYKNNGSDYLYLKIPETGKYTQGSALLSDIPYQSGIDIEIPVSIIETEGENIVDTSKAVFPKGYYDGPINVRAVLDKETTNKVINISNNVGSILNSRTGQLTIPTNYDYLAGNASYEIKSGKISDVTYTANPETGAIIFNGGKIETKGWIESDVTLPATYIAPPAVFETNQETGEVSVTTAGWVTKDTTTGGLSKGSAQMTGPTKASSDTTIGTTSVKKDDYYMLLVTTPGYIGGSTTGINLGKISYTLTSGSEIIGATKITSQNWRVGLSTGYTEDTVLNMSVQGAVLSKPDYTGTINVTSAGWIDAGEYGGLLQATITHNTVIESLIDTTINGVEVATGTPYLKVDVTNGYVTPNLSTVVKFDKVHLTSATSTEEATAAITTKKWKVQASTGYNVAPIATVLEVKEATINPEVNISEDYKCSINVSDAGWIDTKTIELSIAAKDQKYTINDADLFENPEFTIDAAAGTLMKSLTIDTSIIYTRLSNI